MRAQLISTIHQLTRNLRPIVLLLAFVALASSYGFNIFGIAPEPLFQSYQKESETLVIGRLNMARSEGVLSRNGSLGWTSGTLSYGDEQAAFLSSAAPKSWRPYLMQVGLQGMSVAIIDRFLPLSPAGRLAIYHFLFASLAAGVIVWIAGQMWCLVNWAAFIGFIGGAFVSSWLTLIAKNLYWTAFLFLLPMAIALSFSRSVNDRNTTRLWLLAGVLFLAFLARFLCGYEFLTTVVLAALTAPILVGVCRDWSLVRYISVSLMIGGLGIAAFAAAFGIQAFQMGGLEDVLRSAVSRTQSSSESIGPRLTIEWLASIAPFWSTLAMYSFVQPVYPELSRPAPYILFALFLALIGLIRRANWIFGTERAKVEALSLTTLAAFFASISWLLAAKPHSYIHSHIDTVLWSIPFFPMAGALTCFFASEILRNGRLLVARPDRAIVTFAALLLPVFIAATLFYDGFRKPHELIVLIEKFNLAVPALNVPDDGLEFRLGHDVLFMKLSNCDAVPATDTFVVQERFESTNRNVTYRFAYFQQQVPPTTFQRSLVGCYAMRGRDDTRPDKITIERLNGSGVLLWQKTVSVNAVLPKTLKPAPITDENWNRGVSRGKAGLVVTQQQFAQAWIRVGDYLNGQPIIQLDSLGQYVNIWLSGGVLSAEDEIDIERRFDNLRPSTALDGPTPPYIQTEILQRNLEPVIPLGAIYNFSDRYALEAINFENQQFGTIVSLTWRRLGPPLPNESIFFHFLDSIGNITAQLDRKVCQDCSNPKDVTQWIERFYVPESKLASSRRIGVGLYNPAQGSTLKTTGGTTDWDGGRAIIAVPRSALPSNLSPH